MAAMIKLKRELLITLSLKTGRNLTKLCFEVLLSNAFIISHVNMNSRSNKNKMAATYKNDSQLPASVNFKKIKVGQKQSN